MKGTPDRYNNEEWGNLFYYDESSETRLRWKVNYGWTGYYFINKKDSVAGNLNGKNETDYFKVNVNKKKYYIHRIIWIILNGPISPEYQINHRNCNPQDNSISNLEVCTSAENSRRRLYHKKELQARKTNSGINGVVLRETKKTWLWVAHWSEDGKLKTRSYSCNLYGFEKAKQLAIDKRNKEIERLNSLGYGYK